MFKSIQEGLQVLRKELRKHLEKTDEFADVEKKDRKGQGLNYRGVIDWPEEEYKAYYQRIRLLEGIKKALGLSKSEFGDFWKETKKKIKEEKK